MLNKLKNKDINKSGFYLVIEGVDFTGKSTIAKDLVKKLSDKFGTEIVVHRREPSYQNFGAKMREVLFTKEMTEEKEILAAQYMLLDRIKNTSEVAQLLRENKIVIQERNFLTALVYNEAKDTKEIQYVQQANRLSLKPDCLALITISDEALKYRLEKAEEERGSLDSYETFEKISKRKKEYLKFGEYIDLILPNSNTDTYNNSLQTLIKIVIKHYKD